MNIQKSIRKALPLTLSGCVSLMLSQALYALPSGGIVTNGAASVVSAANAVTINQTSNRAVIEWSNYNLDAGQTVTYNMARDAAVLNLINQGSRSTINGRITGQGQIYLINPYGITFGNTARVSAGSVIASSLMTDKDEFMQGLLNFYSTSVRGSIINNGQISAATGGNVALLGHGVINNGFINAFTGNVTLASGEAMTLDFDGSGLLQIEVTRELADNIDGLNDAILNTSTGTLQAINVVLEAHVAADIFTNAVNHQGVIQAQALTVGEGGIVRLVGDGGAVTVDTGATIIANDIQRIERLPNSPELPNQTVASLDTASLQSALANSSDPASTGQAATTANTSLGLYNIESPGVRLPADQLEEEF